MTVQDIMTRDVACCMPDTKLNQVARMMVEYDCGEIPITDQSGKITGVVTDRDICCRAVAHDCNPCEMSAGEIMSTPVVAARMNMTVDECMHLMEEHMVRRLPVADEDGMCIGIVSQADLARKSDGKVEEVVKQISQPAGSASNVR